MLAVFVAWVAYIFLFIQFIFHDFRIGSFLTTAVVFGVAFFVLIFWTLHHLTHPRKFIQQPAVPQEAPAAPAPAADDSGTITFRVAGVTFENDDGESRQDILQDLRGEDPDDLVAELQATEYNGEPAVAVLVNGRQVGNVPKKLVREVSAAMEHVATCYISGVRIIGGGEDREGNQLSFGCEITLEY